MAIRSFIEKLGTSNTPADARQYPKQLAEQQARQAAAKRSSVAADVATYFTQRACEANQESLGEYGKFRGKQLPPLRTTPGMRDANGRLPDNQSGAEVLSEALKASGDFE